MELAEVVELKGGPDTRQECSRVTEAQHHQLPPCDRKCVCAAIEGGEDGRSAGVRIESASEI